MEIQVKARGLPGAAGIRRLAVAHIAAALSGFDDRVEEVTVRLEDTNGPDRGGMDKLCRAVIRFRDSSVLIVEELGRDIGRVVERAARRIREDVSRRLAWQRPAVALPA